MVNNFSLHRVFTSHAVLQRERPIRFSGTAPAGSQVKAVFDGQTRETTASAQGEWRVEFPPLAASCAPRTLEVRCAATDETLTLEDLLVGDVWLCSGQSNMEMPVWSEQPFWRAANAEAEVAAANHPQIRLFDTLQTRDIAPKAPKYDLNPGVTWQPCSPATVRTFSACGYFFGRQLQADLGVPIGLIAAYWGGTDIAAWISPDKMARAGWEPFRCAVPGSEEYLAYQRYWKDNLLRDPVLAKWMRDFDATCHYDTAIAAADFDDSGWTPCPKGTLTVPVPGRYAHRLAFDLPAELAGHPFTIGLGYIDDADTTYFNGQKIGSTGLETPEYWVAQRKYQVPAELARPGRNIVTVIHDDHFNNGICNFATIELWPAPDQVLKVEPSVRTTTLCVLPPEFPPRPAINVPAQAVRTELGPNAPCTLYNANVAPWTRYAIRGVIWYQGCHNNGELSYYQLHKMLIEDYREKWGDPAMPFLIVQLAAFEDHMPDHRLPDEYFDDRPIPEYPPYAVTREIQARMAQEYPNVATIVAFDCGNHSDIHPRDKQSLGYRLAKKAEQLLFDESLVADGPTFAGLRMEKEKIRVFFRHTGSGLTTTDGQPPKGFILGDRNGKLVWANAVIEGNTVVVSHPDVPEPQRVRYAFTSFCFVNLVNREGFPAMPFRSDAIDYAKMLAFS